MNGAVAALFVSTPFAVAQSDQNANPLAEVPLVALELPAEAVAHHLGLKSWAFAYTYEGDTFQVGLFYYERNRAGALESRYLTALGGAADPSGQQRITFVIGPGGSNVSYSLGVNDGILGGTIDDSDFDLDSFNATAPTQSVTKLPSTGGTSILIARYLPKDGNVTVTGNPGDMEAYLALEVGAAGP